MKLDREKLAWAAGFFDGEGTVCFSQWQKTKRRMYGGMHMDVAQAHPEVLHKFWNAVGNIGKLYGPYHSKSKRQSPNRKPYWVWSANRFSRCQAVISLLWLWLGTQKKAKYRQTLQIQQDYWKRPRLKTGPKPKRIV